MFNVGKVSRITALAGILSSAPLAGCETEAGRLARIAREQAAEAARVAQVKAQELDILNLKQARDRIYAICTIGRDFVTAQGVDSFVHCVREVSPTQYPGCNTLSTFNAGFSDSISQCEGAYTSIVKSGLHDYILAQQPK